LPSGARLPQYIERTSAFMPRAANSAAAAESQLMKIAVIAPVSPQHHQPALHREHELTVFEAADYIAVTRIHIALLWAASALRRHRLHCLQSRHLPEFHRMLSELAWPRRTVR